MLREETFDTGTHSLNVAIGPESGPPIILLHGVTRRWQTFLPIIPSLATRWQIFALDFRGHGRSDRSSKGYRTIDYVGDVLTLMRNRIPDSVVIYGHSLGSMVAAATASQAPERCG